MRERPGITRDELAQRLELSSDGVKYHLDKLRKAGMICHEGSKKTGRWVVKQKYGEGTR